MAPPESPTSSTRSGTFFEMLADEKKPGPADYTPHYDTKTKAAFSLSSRHYDLTLKKSVPAPTDYSPTYADRVINTSAPYYSIRPKTYGSMLDQSLRRSNSKGPAEYSPKDDGKVPGGTIFGRHAFAPNTVTPAPNHYEVSSQQTDRKEPAYSIRSSEKQVFTTSKQKQYIPGPGAFISHGNMSKRGVSAFNKYAPKNRRAATPGVGYYDVDDKAVRKSTPSFTFSGRYCYGYTF